MTGHQIEQKAGTAEDHEVWGPVCHGARAPASERFVERVMLWDRCLRGPPSLGAAPRDSRVKHPELGTCCMGSEPGRRDGHGPPSIPGSRTWAGDRKDREWRIGIERGEASGSCVPIIRPFNLRSGSDVQHAKSPLHPFTLWAGTVLVACNVGTTPPTTPPASIASASEGAAAPAPTGERPPDGFASKAEAPAEVAVHQPPSIETDLPPGKLGETIKYGRELVDRFPYYLGPKGSVGAYGGNGLGCSSCHLEAGTVPYGLNYFSVHGRYPQYRGREGEILTLAQRVNNCIQRPMSGKPMPLDSPEMVAIVTYMQWLGQGIPVGERVPGDGLMPLEIPDRPADPVAGKAVYEQYCQSCHQADGQGVVAEDGIAYLYPPVWGYMSYQPGSSMHRVMKSAMWIKNNMPRGVTWKNPILTDQQAIDVAAFINDDEAHVRPTSQEGKTEYPHPEDKPVDYHKGPFADPYDVPTHKFGPWAELREWRKENGQYTGW